MREVLRIRQSIATGKLQQLTPSFRSDVTSLQLQLVRVHPRIEHDRLWVRTFCEVRRAILEIARIENVRPTFDTSVVENVEFQTVPEIAIQNPVRDITLGELNDRVLLRIKQYVRAAVLRPQPDREASPRVSPLEEATRKKVDGQLPGSVLLR